MSPEDKQILIESMRNEKNPNPQIPDYAIRMLEDTCARTGLDWKLRHVYLIQRGGKWQVTTSIDGFRLVANNDPEYAGQEGPFWTTGPDQPWTDIPPKATPYAAKIGVVRNKNGVCVTTFGVAKFEDYNAGSPMWRKMGPTMVAKCAEALALRKALPGKLGNLYTIEEMEQADAPKKPKEKKAAAESAQNSTPSDIENDPDFISYKAQILSKTSTAELKEFGAQLSKTNLGLQVKQALSIVYNNHKKFLEEQERELSKGTTNG